jgi:predicted DNA-binding protein
MATRQNSTNGKPKSPRIQVVLPELICEQLTILANNESRTVSNMAKVLIQEGIKKYSEKEDKLFLAKNNLNTDRFRDELDTIKNLIKKLILRQFL